MIQVAYCGANSIYELEEYTNKTIESLEKNDNEVVTVQTLVTSGKTFYSQIVYKKRSYKW